MASEVKKVRIIYRSRDGQYPLFAAMRACGAWEEVGVDPGSEIGFVSGTYDSENMLLDDQVDLIFGSHVTPYLRYDEGRPFVYLGQVMNFSEDVLITKSPIKSIADIKGKRIGDDLSEESHPHGNHILYLRRGGVEESDVTWVQFGRGADNRPTKEMAIAGVLDGSIDAAFVSQPLEGSLTDQGVSVLELEPLPMVLGTTLTTLWSKVADDPDLYKRILRALRLGVAFFLDEKEKMLEIMKNDVGPTLKISSQAALETLYTRNARLYKRSLYPTVDAVKNAFALAVRQRPDLEDRISPIALWDVHFLRELDEEEAKVGAAAH